MNANLASGGDETTGPGLGTQHSVAGEVIGVDYDRDTITVRLDDGVEPTFRFELFDRHDVYQSGQRFTVTFDETGGPAEVRATDAPQRTNVSGYVESVDQDDELVWVYLRDEEGWHRKVMPLQLFHEQDLDRPGAHFRLELDEDGTPLALHLDEAELEMLPQQAEKARPRWTNHPAAEAEPEA